MSYEVPIIRSTRQIDLIAGVGQTVFTFPFPLYDPLDLAVLSQVVPATLFSPVTTGFTTALATNLESATVTFAVAPLPVAGQAVTIRLKGARVANRTTDVTRGGAVQSQPLEQEFDLVEMTLQELRRDADTVATAYGTINAAVATSTAQAAIATTGAATATSQAAVATAEAGIATSGATAATTAATTLSALLASFRGVFLGAFASDAAAGAFAAASSIPLAAGLMYENTAETKFRIYSGTVWGDYDATAQASQSAAALSATNAASSAAAALASQTAAAGSATSSTTSATNASNSATAAAGSATSAAGSATASANSATTSTEQANNSGNSAAAAAASALSASGSATAAQNWATGFTIGTVTEGAVAATITGTAGNLKLNLVIPTSPYMLPAATSSALGGITVSTGLSAISGALSVVYGTTAGTAAQGNDSRITGALQATTAATTYATTSGSNATGTWSISINGIAAAASAVPLGGVMGAGTAAAFNVGISANNVVQLNATGQLPAVDGSLLTNIGRPAIRQTVQSGPGGGTPSFLPATSASLSLTSQTLSAGANMLVVSAANGWASSGQVDTIGTATANLTWSGLIASATNYLYVTVASGALTAGSTTLPPIYQYGGTISTAAGQYTFDIAQMKMFVGTGSTVAQANVVFVGEAVTGASSVTSTVAYQYNGYYDSGYVATLPGPGVQFSKNSNLGVAGGTAIISVKNLVAENTFTVGQEIIPVTVSSAYAMSFIPILNRNTTVFTTFSTNAAFAALTSAGTAVALTAANWALRVRTFRGF